MIQFVLRICHYHIQNISTLVHLKHSGLLVMITVQNNF